MFDFLFQDLEKHQDANDREKNYLSESSQNENDEKCGYDKHGFIDKPEENLPLNCRIDLNKYDTVPNRRHYLDESFELRRLLLLAYYHIKGKPSLVSINIDFPKLTSENALMNDIGFYAFYFTEYYDQISTVISELKKGGNEGNETDSNEGESRFSNGGYKKESKSEKILKLLKECNYQKYTQKEIPFVFQNTFKIDFKRNIRGITLSTVLNYPLPVYYRNNDTVYFEVKMLRNFVFGGTSVSVGLVTDPEYPNFQLPGMLPYSFAINSSGDLESTTTTTTESQDGFVAGFMPYWKEGDIVGIGYTFISGTMFVTLNGKFQSDVVKGFRFQMYPCIGVEYYAPKGGFGATLDVNLGQKDFAYADANIEKWGFCENKNSLLQNLRGWFKS